MEWSDLVGAALRELGADEKMVPGAMLRQRMEVMGARSGLMSEGTLRTLQIHLPSWWPESRASRSNAGRAATS